MTSKPALPVKPCTIRIMDTNGENIVLLENNNTGIQLSDIYKNLPNNIPKCFYRYLFSDMNFSTWELSPVKIQFFHIKKRKRKLWQ